MKSNLFHNILIVRTDRIGDVVLTTPAIKTLRQACPMACITILVSAKTVDLVKGNPYLNEILVDDRRGEHKGLFGFIRLWVLLWRRKFDLAIIFHTKRRYNLVCFLAGIPQRLGYKNNKWGFLLNHPLPDMRPTGQAHEAQYCLDVLKGIGIKARDIDVFLPVDKEAEIWVTDRMQEHNLKPNEMIIIHPGSSDIAKCWQPANFAKLIDQLDLRYTFKIVLIGSSETVSTCEEILRLTQGRSQILNLSGKTTLAQTVSLLRRARLLISNDSGPVHLAAGVGIWVISLFLRNDPGINATRWRPLGGKSFVLPRNLSMAGKANSILTDHILELTEQIITKNSQYEIF